VCCIGLSNQEVKHCNVYNIIIDQNLNPLLLPRTKIFRLVGRIQKSSCCQPLVQQKISRITMDRSDKIRLGLVGSRASQKFFSAVPYGQLKELIVGVVAKRILPHGAFGCGIEASISLRTCRKIIYSFIQFCGIVSFALESKAFPASARRFVRASSAVCISRRILIWNGPCIGIVRFVLRIHILS